MITHVELDSALQQSQEQQDRGIRLEFRNISNRLDELQKHVDQRFEQVDQRFEQVDQRFEQVDQRFEQVDRRFEQVQNENKNLSAMFRNSNSVAGWDDIQPIWLFDPNRSPQYYVPEEFPNKVIKFWRLSNERNHPRLTRLLRAYGVQSLQMLNDDSDSDSESGARSESLLNPPSLEAAVRDNPSLAHSQLARVLGLPYEQIKTNMELHETLRRMRAEHQPSRAGAKHSRDSGSKDADQTPGKRVRGQTRYLMQEDIPEYITIAGVQVRVLGDPSLPKTKSASSPEHVYWHGNSQSPPHRKLVDEEPSRKGVNQGTDSSGGKHQPSRQVPEGSDDNSRKSHIEGYTSFHKGSTEPLSSATSSSQKPQGSRSPLPVR